MQKLQYEETTIKHPLFQTLLDLLASNEAVNAVILFGSVARGDNNYHSDIDLAVWIKDGTTSKELIGYIKASLGEKVFQFLELPRRKSMSIFFDDLTKVDFLIANDLEEVERNYIGSCIPKEKIQASILFDKTNRVYDHLNTIDPSIVEIKNHQSVSYLIDYFLSTFEGCSKHHAKSDAYRFYFNYNIALDVIMKLKYLASGNTRFVYSPKNILNKAWKKGNEEDFYQLKGTLFLPEANQQKRLLLNQFYETVEKLVPEKLDSYKVFCEAILKRDYFWNFRDYTIHNNHLPKEKLYRSATLSLYREREASEKLHEYKIQTVIDLRALRETEELPYSKDILNGCLYVKAPFDPWNQPDWFKIAYDEKSDRATAYRFFLVACQSSFQKAINTILETDGAVLIHCHAGKDRTGLLIGAIQLLLGCEKESVIKDYMASGSDVDEKMFALLFEEVEKHGSIAAFFSYQGVDETKQQQLIDKLTKV